MKNRTAHPGRDITFGHRQSQRPLHRFAVSPKTPSCRWFSFHDHPVGTLGTSDRSRNGSSGGDDIHPYIYA